MKLTITELGKGLNSQAVIIGIGCVGANMCSSLSLLKVLDLSEMLSDSSLFQAIRAGTGDGVWE